MVVGIKYNTGKYIDTMWYFTDYVKFELMGIEFLVNGELHRHFYSDVSCIREHPLGYKEKK